MLIATVFRHCVRAFILYSSTFLVACMDGWMVPLFSAYYPLLFQHFFFYYALLLYSSTAWVLCYCVPAIAFQHYFILCVFPLRVLILFLATSIFSMRISIVLQHFFVHAFLLCSTFLLYSNTFCMHVYCFLALAACISTALDCCWTALGCCWTALGCCWRHVSCLNRTKDPPNTESQKRN